MRPSFTITKNQKEKIQKRCTRIDALFGEWRSLVPKIPSQDLFLFDLIIRGLSCWSTILILEEAKHIFKQKPDIAKKYPSVRWRAMNRIRNEIVHQNGEVSDGEVYRLITQDMVVLEKEIVKLKSYINSLKINDPTIDTTQQR
ncbi:MAG: DUF86 domain-containing protein [Flavobacteriaceae bacterium]|nr:DUF86 domain-containing protein [Flavobacteriaceae bacterium]